MKNQSHYINSAKKYKADNPTASWGELKDHLKSMDCPDDMVDGCAYGTVSSFIQGLIPKEEAVQDDCAEVMTEEKIKQKVEDSFKGISDAEVYGIFEKMETKGIIERLSGNVYLRRPSIPNMPI